MTEEKIIKILKNTFTEGTEGHVEVIDSNGNQDHFNILVISDQFDGIKLIERHRMIYAQLEILLSNEIHALQIKTYTKNEWKNK